MKTKQTHTKKSTKAQATIRRYARHALIPHKNNQYRPHLIRAHGLVAVLIIAVLAQAAYSFSTAGTFQVLGRSADIKTAVLLEDTNQARAANNMNELTLNDKLSQAAFSKAQDMFTNSYWAHTSPSGVEPWKWLSDVGYNYSAAGENLAKNYPTANAAVAAWMNSPSHRENILNDKYQDVGFAVADGTLDGKATTVIVALYGAPVTFAAVQQAAQPVSFSSAGQKGANPAEYFGSAITSLSPVSAVILMLLGAVGVVGIAAHRYRSKLPKAWRKSWRVHHGMYTFVGVLVLGILIIIGTGGGQI